MGGAPPTRGAFPLAPMSWLVWGLTAGLLVLPAYLAVVGVLAGPPARFVLVPVAGLVAVLYAGAWLYARPTRFEITPDALVIVWPARRRRIARAEIAGARALARSEFRRELGWAARIGVGGLWGGFGWAWTSRAGLVDLYVSRQDGLVLVERRLGRPLLLTPEHPEAFAEALRGPAPPAPPGS